MKSLVLSFLCYAFIAVSAAAHPYVFELDKADYTPLDTLTNSVDVQGRAAWANGWISSRMQIPFDFPFLSSEYGQVYFDNTGSIFFNVAPNQGTQARIEMLNNQYVFRDNSYVAHSIGTSGEFIILEYANMYLKSDTTVFVNFQCTLYPTGNIEIAIGPHNLTYRLPQEDAFYSGLDSNNFAWTFFLSGNPNEAKVYENQEDSSLSTLPASGTLYRFKYDRNISIDPLNPHEIVVFPNPFTSSVSIDLGGQLSDVGLEITNMEGKIVWKQTYVRAQTVSLESLPAGSYVLTARSGAAVLTRQVLVKK